MCLILAVIALLRPVHSKKNKIKGTFAIIKYNTLAGDNDLCIC